MNNLKSRLKKIIFLYGLYLYLFNKKEYRHRRNERVFLKKLGSLNLVFDIGANVGNKTELYSKLGAHVIAVEPDKNNCELLTRRFKGKKNVTVLPFAISDTAGVATLFSNDENSAFNTMSQKWKNALEDASSNRWHTSTKFGKVVEVNTITLDQLIHEFGVPDYIKIDVEGYELACIRGLSHPVKFISFEANLPEFKEETLQIIEQLYKISPGVRFNYMINEENFELKDHMTGDDFYNLIKHTERKFMDIFSFIE